MVNILNKYIDSNMPKEPESTKPPTTWEKYYEKPQDITTDKRVGMDRIALITHDGTKYTKRQLQREAEILTERHYPTEHTVEDVVRILRGRDIELYGNPSDVNQSGNLPRTQLAPGQQEFIKSLSNLQKSKK